MFALMPGPAEEPAATPLPAEESVIILPPPHEPEIIPPLEESVVDLQPIEQAMAAPAAEVVIPRMDLVEPGQHQAPAPLADAEASHQAPPPVVATIEPVPVEPLEPAAVAMPVEMAEPAAVAPRAPATGAIARTIALMGLLLPYSLVALMLRLVMARLFFLHGQAKVEGPSYLLSSQDLVGWPGVHWVVTLPMTVKDQTYAAFAQMTHLPMPSWIAAPVVSYAEFILPICLLLGFATRFAALGFLIMTVVIAVFVAPEAFWATQVYWGAMLLVLMSLGPGVVSVDAIIRHFHRK